MNKYQLLEARIERIVELEYNQLDKRLTNGLIDQDKYEEEARSIDEWARWMYDDLSMKDVG